MGLTKAIATAVVAAVFAFEVQGVKLRVASSNPNGAAPTRRGPRAVLNFGQLSVRGIGSAIKEGVDVEKGRAYEVDGAPTDPETFREALHVLGDPLAVTCRNGSRNYPNQDNFLVELTTTRKGPSAGSRAELGLLVVTDGHGALGHVISSYAVERTREIWLKFVPRFLTKFANPESAARTNMLQKVIGRVFVKVQKAFEAEMMLSENDHGGRLRELVTQLTGRDLFELDIRSGMEAAGATMSVTIVDFAAKKVHVASLGDSPVWGRFREDQSLQPLVGEQSAEDENERVAIVKRLRDEKYHLTSAEVAEVAGGHRRVYLMYERPNTVAQNDRISISAGLRAPHNQLFFDFRLGSLQPTGNIGHFAHIPGVAHQPVVRLHDLASHPIDYLLMSSDGLTHALRLDARLLLVNEELRELYRTVKEAHAGGEDPEQINEALNAAQPRLVRAYLKMFNAAARNNVHEAEIAHNEFSELHRTFGEEVDRLARSMVQNALDKVLWEGKSNECLQTLSTRLTRFMPYNTDDSSTIYFKLGHPSPDRRHVVRRQATQSEEERRVRFLKREENIVFPTSVDGAVQCYPTASSSSRQGEDEFDLLSSSGSGDQLEELREGASGEINNEDLLGDNDIEVEEADNLF